MRGDERRRSARIAERIGYPLMVRPSFVLGGRAMEVVHDEQQLVKYVEAAVDVSPEHPILIDRFLANATETEADAISDGENAFVPSVMEHVELAGIHSGDSACVIPPISISARHVDTIPTIPGALRLNGRSRAGGIGTQSRTIRSIFSRLILAPIITVPLVSKVCDIQMAQLAPRVMLGERISNSIFCPSRSIITASRRFPLQYVSEVDPFLVLKCVRQERCLVWLIRSVWRSTKRRRRLAAFFQRKAPS